MNHSSESVSRRRSAGSVIRLIAGDERQQTNNDGNDGADCANQSMVPGAAALGRKLRDLILDGSLQPGERLPSSRTLARDLKCARGTVETSYGDLESEGLIERRRGDGSYVTHSLAQLSASANQDQRRKHTTEQDRLADPDAKPLRSGLSARGSIMTSIPACAHPTDARSFGAGIPDLREFPWPVWRRLWADCLRVDADGLCGYSHPQGLPRLRAALARWLRITRGIKCDPDRILVLHSSQQALALSAMLLFDAGNRVAIEDPGYPGAHAAFAASGLQTVAVPVDDYGIATDRLVHDSALAGVYLTPSYQNPTGGTLPLQRRLDLIHWAQEHNAWILEDDYGGGLTYDNTPISALAGLDPNGRTIYVGTASKLLFPGLRIAWMVLPEALVDPFVAFRANSDGHNPALMQMCLARFIDDGHLARHNRRMTNLYRARRGVLAGEIDAINAALPHPILRVRPSNAGLKLVVDLLPPLSDSDVAIKAREQGLDLPTLSSASAPARTGMAHDAGRSPHNGFILGYSGMTPDEIRGEAQSLRTALWACLAG